MPRRSMTRKWVGLPAWILIAFVPAATAVFVDTGPWYGSLNRPAWTPPSWVFAPVWTVLYLLMGIAAWRVWAVGGEGGPGGRGVRGALALFLVNLVFNAAWTWLFFGLHLITAAAVEIVALWALTLAAVVLFWGRDRIAGALLVPYLLWVTYAATLSIGYAVLNARAPAAAGVTQEHRSWANGASALMRPGGSGTCSASAGTRSTRSSSGAGWKWSSSTACTIRRPTSPTTMIC